MQLQSQTSGNVVREHPLSEFARIEQTVRAVTCATRVLAEGRRKQHCVEPSIQNMPRHKITGEFVVCSAAQHEFNFVDRIEGVQVLNVKTVSLAGIRALHVHDLD